MPGKDKAAMLRLGYFSEPGYITVGDSYGSKQASQDARLTGHQMLSGSNRQPKYFSAPQRLFENDLYRTWDEIQREWRNAKSKGAIVEKPFRPSNPTRIHSGVGDNYGCFDKIKSETTASLVKKGPIVHPLRNIVTNPSKKGSYGTFGTVLGYSSRPPNQKVEFPYMPDPYDAQHQKALELTKARRGTDAADARPAFKPASLPKKGGPGYSQRGFTSFSYLGGAPAEKKITIRKKGEAAPDEKTPFYPSRPPKSGFSGFLNKFPEHKPDPYECVEIAAKKDRAQEKAAMKALGDRPAFAGASFPKSVRTPSVFRMNIKLPARTATR